MRTAPPETNLMSLVAIFLLLSLASFPAGGAGSEPLCTADGCVVPPADQPAPCLPAYNDVALFVAGLNHRESTLTAAAKKPAWIRHARFIKQSWESFTRGRLAPMRQWASRELAAATGNTVFYPFSGPDFVNVFTLFPHAKTYLLIALEPVGEVPDFSVLDDQKFFASLQRSLCDLLQLDFFLTNKMATCLGKSEVKGTLPVLMFFLAREQARILDIRYWVMKSDGGIEEFPAASRSPRPRGIPGVRLDFVTPGAAEKQTLYYFQFNLCNKSWERRPQFVSFLKSFGPMMTFAKAASYLMFKPYFSDIRQFILDQSQCVVQGDSAIPLKYFDRAGWNLRFYGTYSDPIPRFRNCYQADMADIYKRAPDIQPLPFGIDYRHRLHTSNLMFATKKVKLVAGDAN